MVPPNILPEDGESMHGNRGTTTLGFVTVYAMLSHGLFSCLLFLSAHSLASCNSYLIVDSAENLGEVLRGDRIENSPYVVCSFSIHCFLCPVLCTVGL